MAYLEDHPSFVHLDTYVVVVVDPFEIALVYYAFDSFDVVVVDHSS